MITEAQIQKRNFLALAFHGIFYRLGWLFKTESVIIPAVTALLGASNFLLGLFPMVSRFGETIPPLFFANIVKPLKRRKPFMLLTYSIFAGTWFLIFVAFVIIPFSEKNLLLLIFFLLYVVFFIDSGAFQVAQNLVYAQVIPISTRGRLMGTTGVIGGLASFVVTFLVVMPILKMNFDTPLVPYTLFFFLSALLFFISALFLVQIQEKDVIGGGTPQSILQFTKESLRLIRTDRNYKMFFLINGVFACHYGTIQFYTMYAKVQLHVPNEMLAYYLAVQVLASSLGSWLFGPMTDRVGNRLVLRIISVLMVFTPLVALWTGQLAPAAQPGWVFCLVYALIGLCLPFQQISTNYLLEITPTALHPNYLGITRVLSSVFLAFPLAVGFFMDTAGYATVFIGVAIFLVSGFVISWFLYEPRQHREDDWQESSGG